MTGGSPQTDPRREALRRELQFDITTVRLILEAVDAADEAAGIRRVTREELADNLELARRQERERLIGEFAKAARVAYKGEGETDARRLLDVAERVRNGYPVGGSNTVETVVRLLRFVAGFISARPTESAAAGIGPVADSSGSPAGGVS
jgi:hypothetical protein